MGGNGEELTHDELAREADRLAQVKRHYKLKPRQQIAAEGVEAPPELLARVLEELLKTRWHTFEVSPLMHYRK